MKRTRDEFPRLRKTHIFKESKKTGVSEVFDMDQEVWVEVFDEVRRVCWKRGYG